MDPNPVKAKEGLGTGLIVLLLVLVVDVPVIIGASMPLMGHSVIPGYKYIRETRMTVGVLLVYTLIVLALGLYWYRTQQRTARLVGMLLGLIPVAIIAWQFIVQLLEGPPEY